MDKNKEISRCFSHVRPPGFAGGYQLDDKWSWDKAVWRQCHCGLWHSNRYIPKKYWDQEWIVNKNRKKAGIIVIRDNHEVWITQSYHKCFGFPKGEKEKNESIEECAKREFFEETGFNIDHIDLNKCKLVNTYIEDVEYIFYIFHVSDEFEIDSCPIDDVEITSYGWYPLNKLLNLKLSKAIRKISVSI